MAGTMAWRRPGTVPLALLALLAAAPLGRAAGLAVPVVGGRYDTNLLTEQDPVLGEIFRTAQDVGFRVGTWGGASRDFLLGRGPPPSFSDVDMVFDSRELWAALTSEGPVGFVKKSARLAKGFWRVARVGGVKALRRYTYLDIKQGGRALTMSVAKLINSGGATLNQVGLMSDGSVYDPTGGVADLEKGQLRYRIPRPAAEMIESLDDIHNPSPYDVMRMIRFKVQYPELEWAPGTFERLQEIMALYAPGSEYTREVASYSEGLGGKVRNLLPQGLRKPLAALQGNLFGPSRKQLWPYLEYGMKKILASTPDPAESLRLMRELGVDGFAREVGLGHGVDELEQRVAALPTPLGGAGTPPAEPPTTTTGEGAGAAGEVVLERLSRQAYERFLEAQASDDPEAARNHYQVYLAARARLGAP